MALHQRTRLRTRRTGALVLAACCALTAACAPLDALTGAGSAAATAPAPLSTAGPVGESLVIGSGVPQPTPSAPVPAPTVTQDVTTTVTVTATAKPSAEASASAACSAAVSHRVVKLGVNPVASQGSATVTWYSRSSASLRGWRVAAERQDVVSGQQPPLIWKDVAAPPGCAAVSTTVTGLTSGSRYQFWLHRVVDDGTGADPLVEMVGRSSVVAVP